MDFEVPWSPWTVAVFRPDPTDRTAQAISSDVIAAATHLLMHDSVPVRWEPPDGKCGE